VFERDERAAFEWCKKAVEHGLVTAQYVFGYYHEYGIGVKKDTKVALLWYEKAAKGGSDLAKRRLEEERNKQQTPPAAGTKVHKPNMQNNPQNKGCKTS
jgi:TPR repeat protein